MKVIINKAVGSFNLSHKAIQRYAELKGINLYGYYEKENGSYYRSDDEEAIETYSTAQLTPQDTFRETWSIFQLDRHDPLLVQVVEELKEEANTSFSRLKIVEIPEGVQYEIHETDAGIESIHEVHRIWY